jgi:hypothetical protein
MEQLTPPIPRIYTRHPNLRQHRSRTHLTTKCNLYANPDVYPAFILISVIVPNWFRKQGTAM